MDSDRLYGMHNYYPATKRKVDINTPNIIGNQTGLIMNFIERYFVRRIVMSYIGKLLALLENLPFSGYKRFLGVVVILLTELARYAPLQEYNFIFKAILETLSTYNPEALTTGQVIFIFGIISWIKRKYFPTLQTIDESMKTTEQLVNK